MILTETPPLSVSPSAAAVCAERTFEANFAAIGRTQPRLAREMRSLNPGVDWVFARDGSLTCRDEAGRWWAGCSLPRRAGAAMLRRLVVPGVVGCLLAPAHAGEILASLKKLEPTQAVIVLQPDLRALRVALGCGDFEADIVAHRLWFAWGESWEAELSALLEEQPGLPTPELFIRTPALAEELGARLIPAGEAVFGNIGTRRAAQIAELQSMRPCELATAAALPAKKVCILARSKFRLWDDAGFTLAATMRAATGSAIHLDPDDPASTSALALARAAHDARAVITAGVPRAQLPQVISANCAVLTWVTTPVIPAADPQFPADGLLLADPAWAPIAHQAGWPVDRVRIAAWPVDRATPDGAGGEPKTIALLADTCPLDTPRSELELSSHHLLWEIIREDLLNDPFRLGADVASYLDRQRQAMGIAEDGFAATWFIERLLLPAYQQGLVRVLIAAGIPLSLHGEGWGNLTEFCGAWKGPVRTRKQFHAAVTAATALVYPWPLRHAHALDAFGRPILTPGRQATRFLRDVKTALVGATSRTAQAAPVLSRSVIEEWVNR